MDSPNTSLEYFKPSVPSAFFYKGTGVEFLEELTNKNKRRDKNIKFYGFLEEADDPKYKRITIYKSMSKEDKVSTFRVDPIDQDKIKLDLDFISQHHIELFFDWWSEIFSVLLKDGVIIVDGYNPDVVFTIDDDMEFNELRLLIDQYNLDECVFPNPLFRVHQTISDNNLLLHGAVLEQIKPRPGIVSIGIFSEIVWLPKRIVGKCFFSNYPYIKAYLLDLEKYICDYLRHSPTNSLQKPTEPEKPNIHPRDEGEKGWDAWFKYFHECKKNKYKYTLKELAHEINYSADWVYTQYGYYKSRKGLNPG